MNYSSSINIRYCGIQLEQIYGLQRVLYNAMSPAQKFGKWVSL